MRITWLETKLIGLGFRNCIVVEIHTDDGLVGYGETVLKRRSKTVEQNILELGRYLVGQDPLRIEDHHEKMYRDSFWVGGPLHGSAISAIDVALWDLKGKALGAPIYQLLGGPTRDEIPVYCHCPAGSSPAEFGANLSRCKEWGYFAAKTTLPLFYGGGAATEKQGYSGARGYIPASWRETEWLPTATFDRIAEFFAAGREAVGPEFELAVDCHGRLNPADAVQLCEVLAPFKLMFIEEPTPPEDPGALREVAAKSVTRIASGERLASVYEVRPFLESRSLAILQVDLANCGGLTAGKKIAALAESHYVSMCPHNPNGPLATAAAVHLMASIPNCFMLEMIGSPEDLALHRQMAPAALHPTDGYLPLPTGPGLGVEPAAGCEELFPYQPFEGWR
jgi:galactonate dehydratase